MIICLSTSSPLVSAALFNSQGELIDEQSQLAHNAANSVLFVLLDKLLKSQNVEKASIERVVADVGPGSFTGIKVAVTAAKSLGYAFDCQVAAVTSFDLIDAKSNVAVPVKRGQYIVRSNGIASVCNGTPESDAIGYGFDFDEQNYPHAAKMASAFEKLQWIDAESLEAYYFTEPNISTPKKPYQASREL